MFTWLGLFEASVVGGICIALFFLISLLLGERYRASYKKIIWLLIALRMCLPISVSFLPKPIIVQMPVYVLRENRQAAEADNVLADGMKLNEESPLTTASPADRKNGNANGQSVIHGQFTSQNLLVLLWGLGCVAVLLFNTSAHFLFRRKMLQRSEKCANERVLKTTIEIAEEMRLKNIPQVRLMKDARTSPFTVGIFRNTIFLPDTNYQETDLRYIIRHELIHCAGRDTQIKALLVIVNAIHWFNPLAWFMKSLADQDMELACDEKVLTDTSKEERSEYSEVLMSCIRKDRADRSVFATGYVQGTKFIKRRFRNIFNMQKKSGKAAAGVMIVLLILVSAGIGFETGRIVYAKSKIPIDTGIELRTDVTGDGRPDQVRVHDNNDILITSVTLNTGDGQTAQFDYDEELWASSYLVSGDLNGNGAADIVLMRVGFGMHLTGPVNVLYVAEESGKSVWKEYSRIFLSNPGIDMEQPKTFDDIECLGATIVEKEGRHCLRLIAMDMEYFAETLGDDDQVLCIDCSWRDDGWFLEDIQTVTGYYSEHKEEGLLENNIYNPG